MRTRTGPVAPAASTQQHARKDTVHEYPQKEAAAPR